MIQLSKAATAKGRALVQLPATAECGQPPCRTRTLRLLLATLEHATCKPLSTASCRVQWTVVEGCRQGAGRRAVQPLHAYLREYSAALPLACANPVFWSSSW